MRNRLRTAGILAGAIVAQQGALAGTHNEMPIELESVSTMKIDIHRGLIETIPQEVNRGSCINVASYTDADFTGGSFIAQGGFAEDEIAAASYTLDPSEFPIKLELAEMIFATSSATQSTTTEWSLLVWEGTPQSGTLAYVFSSDDVILPHIVLPPGTNGVNVQVSVDPGDPEQIVINNNGTATFSIGYRIDQHNQQLSDPCLTAPPSCCNAFPTTDVGGLSSALGNYLCAVNCGPFGCASGCNPFSALGACTPSGDWVIRATWSSFNCQSGVGPCCKPDGTCEVMLQSDCIAMGGDYQGDGQSCLGISCPEPVVACCFPSGGCLDLIESDCVNVGGVPQAPGTDCASIICFETGACCLPDGTCMDDVSPADCTTMGGAYQGVDTTCATTDCPDPLGACCFPTGFCLELTEADCVGVGATWNGALTTCAGDGNGNGTDDNCETTPCEGDTDGDGMINFNDLNDILGNWGTAGPTGDVAPFPNGDGAVNFEDLNLVLGNWGTDCNN